MKTKFLKDIEVKEELIENTRVMMELSAKTEDKELRSQELLAEMNVQAEMVNNLIRENARVASDQEEYQKKYDALVGKYNALKEEYDTLQQEIESLQGRRLRMETFIHSLERLDKVPLEFDEDRWCCLVDKVIVKSKKDIRFVLATGEEVIVSL